MIEWLDVVLADDEEALQSTIASLDPASRSRLIAELASVIGSSGAEIEENVLRLLIERARPFALPGRLWSRSPVSSDPIAPIVESHLADIKSNRTPERLRAMTDLQSRFAEQRPPRGHIDVEPLLKRQDFRCALCGLVYYHDELQALGTVVSPHGFRPRVKTDPLKPHWSSLAFRRPRADHVWPVSLYGSNRAANLQAICDACNEGKANLASLCQSPRYLGIPASVELNPGTGPITKETFVAQMWRSPRCVDTGLTARDVELTVRVRDSRFPLVLDNLETVSSPD